jgi:hypothetical protein
LKFPYKLRFEHCYVPGKTGHGKTTLLENMALADIENGAGLTFIDPGGEAVLHLLHNIPEKRKDDCVYLDMATPIPFDFLTFSGPTEKDELIKDLVYLVLKGIQNAPSAESILIDFFYTALSCSIPVCFLDVYYFFTKTKLPGHEKNRFQEILDATTNSDLRARWQTRFPTDERLQPILIRMTPYVRNHTLQQLFGATNPSLKISGVMNQRKILLVNLGGASQAAMEYGSLLFAKMRQEVFRRHSTPQAERIPHFLFIDEFQTFPNPDTFHDVLTMARKYRLALTLANLTLQHLDPKMKAGLGIISNYIIFSLHPDDARFFRSFTPDDLDLANLPKYVALYKIGSDVLYQKTPAPLPIRAGYAEYIKKRTVDKFGCPQPKTVLQSKDGDGNNPTPETVLPDDPED